MAEIAQIISAIAAVVTALGGVVFAASKLGPVLNAVNKMLTDQHKRAMEAKKSAVTQIPISTIPSTEGVRSTVFFWIIMSSSFISLFLYLFIATPPSSSTVAVCAIAVMNILSLEIVRWSKLILEAVLLLVEVPHSLPDNSN